MGDLRKVSIAVLLMLPASTVMVESPGFSSPGSDTGLPSTQAPSMVQTKMRRSLALSETAAGLAGAALRLCTAGRGNREDQERQLEEASTLVNLFRSLAAVGNGTDNKTQHLKDIDKDQLASIKDVLNRTFLANLQNLSAEDQAEVTSDHQLLVGCGTSLQSALGGAVAGTLAALNASRRSHEACRATEATAVAANATAWTQYSALVELVPDPPSCPPYKVNLETMSKFFNSDHNPLQKWYEDHGPTFLAKKAAFYSAHQALQAGRARCNGLQGTVEQDYCVYQTRLKSTCSTHDACHRTTSAKYAATKARVVKSEATRKSLYKSGTAIVCHLDAILTGSGGHDDCTRRSSGIDTASLSISYPAEPNKSSCDTSAVSAFPCDASWISAEFSWMPQGTVAAACSRCPSETPAPTPAPTPA